MKKLIPLMFVFFMLAPAMAFTIGDSSCAGTENSLYIYDFNETPDDWGYVSKLGDENIDYNVEIVNTSYNSLINGTALHFNASSTGANDGILFNYDFYDHSNNLSLGFPVTTVEFDLYNVSMSGMGGWEDIGFVIRQNDWMEGTTLEYVYDGIPSYYSNGDQFHAILNSVNHDSSSRGYACSLYWTGNGTVIESYTGSDCPYEIDDEFSSFYMLFSNNGDSDLYLDFVIDNLVVSQQENVFNSPVDCMGKEGFPYVHGYGLNNQAGQGFTNAIYSGGVPVAYYRCQQPLDNQFALEDYYATEFIPSQPEYSSRTQLYSDYPEYSLVWVDDDNTYHHRSFFTMREDVLFLGDYSGCVDIHQLCVDDYYPIYEAEAGSVTYPEGWIYNKTEYSPVILNKTPMYVCGNADSQDTLETADVILQNDGTWDTSPFNLKQFGEGWNDFELTWLPYRDYDTCWDCIDPNMTAYWEKRILDEDTGLCAYYEYFGITPCPLSSLEDYLYCNAVWNVDNDFVVSSVPNYQNNLTETVHLGNNQTFWIDDIIHANTIETWYGKNESLISSYMDLWNTTISEYFTTGLCRNDIVDYAPYNDLSPSDPDNIKADYGYDYLVGIGNALNFLEGVFSYPAFIPNNYTVEINDYYVVEDATNGKVYRWTREVNPLLEVAKYVSVSVPVTMNMTPSSESTTRLDTSTGTYTSQKIGSTYYINKYVSESQPTWANSPENFTVEYYECDEGAFFYEFSDRCETFGSITGFMIGLTSSSSGIFSAVVIVMVLLILLAVFSGKLQGIYGGAKR